ncbi:glycosyltransferase family 10 [uncultured Bacteroides sp.]|jgi:hypothetical protein|uniref:glycosyltransferase family 10 domain-containing protein n=1 Tax=unclassified Bacteroides TaxID=2646097 RepID=UPI00033A3F90|nr:glycosyltransferase family 10 [uncultured Bacteroides sp.]CDA84646.1 uncharacterized protein BN772_03064 [Bacteroides sp. CAG:754]
MLVLFWTKIRRTKFSIYDQLRMDELLQILPCDIHITYDRDKMSVADVVAFNLPFLYRELEGDLEKPEHQIWVAWSYESEVNYPWMFSDELKDIFDLWMTYHLDSDIVLPYYDYTFKEKLFTPPCEKTKDVCMFISSPVNKSHRLEYISELIEYLPIDSYGNWRRNCVLDEDKGYITKLDIIKQYKFTIAFENAVSQDYVTEKFFEPLTVGSVPIYLGAPNIETFSPGEHAFIDVRDYTSPKDLADDIMRYCRDISRYDSLLEWKRKTLSDELAGLIEEQREHAFIRMVRLAKGRIEARLM